MRYFSDGALRLVRVHSDDGVGVPGFHEAAVDTFTGSFWRTLDPQVARRLTTKIAFSGDYEEVSDEEAARLADQKAKGAGL
ncbi:hypothetical protein [Lolliginicoccus suaedae]|uniref:hypothetical protein n=1 Tax=Lolliginicoccus suaedae TaxID=2605429 RepID=UPI0011EC4AAE|nr:hypothetical protein [Lolliginicoccus suaedae]